LGAASEGAGVPPGTLPALLAPFARGGALRTEFPLFLGAEAAGEAPGEPTLCLPVGELLGRAARQSGLLEGSLADNLERLERCLVETVQERVPARVGLTAAGAAMVEGLDPTPELRQRLEGELQRLAAAVPEGGQWLPQGPAVLPQLLRAALLEHHRPPWPRYRSEVASLAERVAALLAEDRRHATGEGTAEAESGALGGLGSRFLDGGALEERLRHRGSHPGGLDPARRQRLEAALARLREPAEPPEPILVLEAGAPGEGLAGWRTVEAADPCTAAAERFEQEAGTLAEGLRAVHTARLELAGDFDETVHGPWLERFHWRHFSPEELRLLPPVVVWLSGAPGWASLSRLLLSGRPIQVVAEVAPERHPAVERAATEGEDGDAELHSYRFELAYLGISHREAVVQQTLALRPLHAMAGFRRAAASQRTGLHVVGEIGKVGETASLDPYLVAGAALDGRAHPLFLYDPEAGATWARRMGFDGNPAAAEDWPTYPLEVSPEKGEAVLTLAFTFADFALLDPDHGAGFHLLPPGTPDQGLMPLAEWLALEESADPEAHLRRLPFLWVVDAEGVLRRAVVTRPLAHACRDRLDFWRTLQELSGARNEYAERAAREAREAERERLEAEHRAALARLERETAERLADRLTAALLASGTAPSAPQPSTIAAVLPSVLEAKTGERPSPAAPPPPTEPAVTASSAPVPSESSPATADPAAAVEPYIDTPLCTSCNECIQINPALFAYDDNKQAYIADPTAGTFQQLVKAAERCTARIIHPGTPLDPDEPDLETWVKRAQPFQ
jgi:ferredoxin